jgi:hypothetical protein
MRIMSERGHFSVCQFFANDAYEYVVRFVSAREAFDTAVALTRSVGARIGTTRRVIITNGGDDTCWDWLFGPGLIFPPPCQFSMDTVTDEYVLLRDSNAPGTRTLTNSAEQVVALMHAQFPGRRVYYYDTEGRLDEMKHSAGVFEGFAPGGPL